MMCLSAYSSRTAGVSTIAAGEEIPQEVCWTGVARRLDFPARLPH